MPSLVNKQVEFLKDRHRKAIKKKAIILDIHESVDLKVFLFDVEANGFFYRRHMVDIPRIKFFHLTKISGR